MVEILFRRPHWRRADDKPFELQIDYNVGGDYSYVGVTRKQALKAVNDLQHILELEAQGARKEPMEWGDLYAGTGIEDPDDIIF